MGRTRIDLADNWAIRSSADVSQTGDEISKAGFDTRGWYPATVPTTVINTLVKNGVYPDPYYGLNLRSIPGTTYDFGDNFAVDPMPADSPFAVSWWYRKEFTVSAPGRERSARPAARRLWLNFESINYRANIWLNGQRIAGSDDVRGMYRTFEFDVTDLVVPGVNTLALEVFAPTERDLSISFVDWNPLPADKDMGLVRDVYLLTSGPVALRNVQLLPQLNGAFDRAQVTVSAELINATAGDLQGTLRAAIGDLTLAAPVTLAAGESRRITMPAFTIDHPQLWWPNGLGPQNLYSAHTQFEVGTAVSDEQDVPFGIRQVTSELDAQQHRLFRINGRPILIRGAAWTPDMLLRIDPDREEADVRYAREMNLNTIRFEGRLEMDDHFFDLADRYGVMLMPGWCCCSFWEEWDRWQPSDYTVAAESLRSQLRRLRNHPSVFVFLYGSDNAPPPDVERMYLNVFAEEGWPNPTVAAAANYTTPGGGHTGVKMTGPYDYVAPSYWLLEQKEHGGAWGFITETSPGPAIPEIASLRQMMPEKDLWPIGSQIWNFHAGSGSFADVNQFTLALTGRYGAATDLADYVRKSQAMTYEAERAMFEAYGRNKYTSTGVIQWMMNNAWPGLIWHLYDFYLRPGGGYFGTRKACEPVHVQYSYDDSSIVVVNSLYAALPGYSVTAKVYNLDLTEKFSRTAAIDIPQDSSTRVFSLPAISGLSRTYFVRLTLSDAGARPVSSNFYWLSTQPDVIDWVGGDYRFAPITTYMDLTGLAQLPPAQVDVSRQSDETDPDQVEHITVRNPSSQLAFMVHLAVLKGRGGEDVAPVYWSDNYFELFPGEERQITASYPRRLLGGAASYVQADGWNVAPPVGR